VGNRVVTQGDTPLIQGHNFMQDTQSQQLSGMRAFMLVWFGQVVSLLGTGMTRFALTLWAWDLTGQATALALVAFFSFTPGIIFSPIAGALVDRWDRKLVMMLSDLAAGLGTVVIFLLALTGNLHIWHIYVVSFFAGIFEAFQFPAYSAAITVMVDKSQYSRTSAMMGLAESISGIAAPIGAAALFAFVGLQGILLIDIITFVFAITMLLMIYIPPAKRSEAGTESKGSLLKEALFGFRYIAARPSLLGMQLVFFFNNLLFFFTTVLVAPMILARTGNNETILAAVSSAMGVGGVIGGLVMGATGGFKRKVQGVIGGFLLAAVCGITVLGLGQVLIVWVIGAFFDAFSGPIINSSNQSLWQVKVPPDVQGKVFATRRLIAQVAAPISMLLAGPLADYVFEPAMQPDAALAPTFGWLVGTGDGAGMSLMFVALGSLMIVVCAIAYSLPHIRHVDTIVPDFDEVPAA
jgi:DHA3 family macrolide efflux protein-like MFS transporter